jgi:UDP-glucose 4-epimerase
VKFLTRIAYPVRAAEHLSSATLSDAARTLNHALVVGGAGFIGSAVVRSLREAGVRVTGVSRHAPEHADADWVTGDAHDVPFAEIIREREIDALFDFSGSADVPGSLAAPAEDLDRNAGVPIAILEELRKLERSPLFVYGSTATVYGRAVRLPVDEDHPTVPLSPYGVSKLTAEQYVSLYHRLYDIPSLSLRIFSVYGPGQRKQAVFDLLRKAREPGPELEVKAPPQTTRDFVYVRDVADIAVALAQRGATDAAIYNVASGHGTTLEELANGIIAVSGAQKRAVFAESLRLGDPDRYVGGTAKLEALGIAARVGLEQGLAETAEWLSADLAA